MSNVVQIKQPPLLFDAALCVKPSAVLKGLAAANEQARFNAKAAALTPPNIAQAPATDVLRETEEAFTAIREHALLLQDDFAAMEAYVAKAIGNHFGVEANVFGFCAPLANIEYPSFLNSMLKVYVASTSAAAISAEPDFYICGGRFSGVQVRMQEFVRFSPDDWVGIHIVEEDQ